MRSGGRSEGSEKNEADIKLCAQYCCGLVVPLSDAEDDSLTSVSMFSLDVYAGNGGEFDQNVTRIQFDWRCSLYVIET